ncbi:MAG: HNH endonuclease signature motif containing protein, partial [Rhodococcus sp. (in: high G+C Gram-positive bacteria)]
AERSATVRKLPRGQAELRLRGPQEDIAAMWHSILGTARQVCAGDPRRLGTRFFDAARAILTGTPLPCECSADACPHRGTHPTGPSTRAYIVIDAATAAGLAGEPGHLQGWGEVPPDVARRIAADATWQAIITDALAPARCQCTETPETDDPPVPTDTREVRRTRARPAGWTPQHGRLNSRSSRDTARKLERLRGSPKALHHTRAADPTGHGGHTTPPTGALTYRPSESLAALVTARYSVCVHPGCAVPSSDCDLDHVVPFDHDDPTTGGWTVLGNLQPLCRRHHGLKTRKQWRYRMLTDGIVHIRDPHGRDYLTGPGE